MLLRIFLAVIALSSPLHASLADNFERAISNGQIVWPLALAFGAGFLTSLSPCVYPLIPITLTIMGARRFENHWQGFFVALSYVSGMTLVYASLGAIFASIGMIAGSVMQQPMFLIAVAFVFALMSLSLFGVINVVIPQKLLTKLSSVGGSGKRGAFLMGMVAGVLAAPCTGPVLGFILTLIANNSNLAHGIILMLAFSVGMGLPFLILGSFFSSVARLPKSGPWMDGIKNFLGAIILGTAFYYLSLASKSSRDIFSALNEFGFTSLLAVFILGIVLLCLRTNSRAVKTITSTCGALFASIALVSMLVVDEKQSAITTTQRDGLDWFVINAEVKDLNTFDKLLGDAKSAGRPVMIDFYADWCVACKQFELLTFKDENVVDALKRFTLIRIDATTSSKVIATIENRLRITGLPTIVFVDEKGVMAKTRVLGFQPPEKFLPVIKSAF